MAVIWDNNSASNTASPDGYTVTKMLGNGVWSASRSTSTVSSGKWYWEIQHAGNTTTAVYNIAGAAFGTMGSYPGDSGSGSHGYGNTSGAGRKYFAGIAYTFGTAITGTDVIGVAIDLDAGKIYFARNGIWQDSADPASGANPAFSGLPAGDYGPAVGMRYLEAAAILRASASRLTYTPPTGYSPLDVPVPIRAELVQSWGIKTGVDLVQPWTDAAVLRQSLTQPWSDAPVVRAELVQRWESSFTLRALLNQQWSLFGSVRSELVQPWAITAALVRAELAQPWELRERDLLRSELVQRWAVDADQTLLRYTVEVLVEGEEIGFYHLNVEGGSDQDVLTAEVHVGSEADYLRCAIGAALSVVITSAEGVDTFSLVITAPHITEEHGNTQYIIEAMSPGAFLGEPYADSVEGELSGKASAIASILAGSVPFTWVTVDWDIPAATFIASGETPLSLMKRLAGAAGGVVQSRPDGSIVVIPEYPIAVNRWQDSPAGHVMVENLDCFTTGDSPELKAGHNRFYICDQLASAVTSRLEEEPVSKAIKIVRGYQTPWTGTYPFEHSGGAWVVIEALGEENRQETETIEVVSGAGRTAYPIYTIEAISWGQRNLGSVTCSEDGAVQASIQGESLLTITYTTRCLSWRVHDQKNESVQLVAP